ncbi:hypothetical protein H634G_10318 [Metarhizium anisopliae BRIP 53293]|uniref:Uncharacterized protein n=1 Tax=Metarhizium anisopliae BRIP 53293 TaxID=1291518 RepID=A0A0D9NKJ7_METAN|nr:hypothetical protein H634G_10318 [Metarhizium anisopliae BRIP 53293]KJK87748.1 hypothetical protein H633G_08411 [Metarhizium anisopliae BRIP 53284]
MATEVGANDLMLLAMIVSSPRPPRIKSSAMQKIAAVSATTARQEATLENVQTVNKQRAKRVRQPRKLIHGRESAH